MRKWLSFRSKDRRIEDIRTGLASVGVAFCILALGLLGIIGSYALLSPFMYIVGILGACIGGYALFMNMVGLLGDMTLGRVGLGLVLVILTFGLVVAQRYGLLTPH